MGRQETKQALDGTRANAFSFDPNELVIITDKRHPLYDPREALPVLRADVLDVATRGIITPIGVRRVEDDNVVLVGKQRTKTTAVANALGAGVAYDGHVKAIVDAIEEFGKDGEFCALLTKRMNSRPLRLPAVARNAGDDIDARMMMRAENAHRRGDDKADRIRAAQTAHEKFGDSVEDIAQAEGVDPKTVARWLKMDVSNGVKKPKRGKAKGPGKLQLRKVFDHPELKNATQDYKVIFGYILGENTKDELLKQHPDLKGIV